MGKNGYSLFLDGLEKGINDKARERAIVVHGANYADPAVLKGQQRLGRSLGCPALPPDISKQVIDTIKGGVLLYIYGLNKAWGIFTLFRGRFRTRILTRRSGGSYLDRISDSFSKARGMLNNGKL